MKKSLFLLVVLAVVIGGALLHFGGAEPASASQQEKGDDSLSVASMREGAPPLDEKPVESGSASSDSANALVKFQHQSDKSLPTEVRFLRPGGVSVNSVGSVIRGRGFVEAMNSLERDMLSDEDALAIRDAYKEGLNSSLKSYGQLRLDSLACGLSVCFGRIAGHGEDVTVQYQAWLASLDGTHAPRTYALMDSEFEMDGPTREFRIVFSTDPSANALVTDGATR